MDADTRHQLKTNELAQAISKLREVHPDKMKYALIVVGVLLVLVIGWKFWSASSSARLDAGFAKLVEAEQMRASGEDVAQAITSLRELIGSESNTTLVGYARLSLSRALIDEALRKPEQRDALFQQAADELKIVSDERSSPDALAAGAAYALATTYESLRKPQEATALYKRLMEEPRFAGSPFRDLAERRLSTISVVERRVELTPGNPPPPPTQPTIEPSPGVFQPQPTPAPPPPTTAPAVPAPATQPAEPAP